MKRAAHPDRFRRSLQGIFLALCLTSPCLSADRTPRRDFVLGERLELPDLVMGPSRFDSIRFQVSDVRKAEEWSAQGKRVRLMALVNATLDVATQEGGSMAGRIRIRVRLLSGSGGRVAEMARTRKMRPGQRSVTLKGAILQDRLDTVRWFVVELEDASAG